MLGYQSQESKKEGRCYLRFHQTIRRAMEYNRELFGNRKGKDLTQFLYEHPLRVAGLTEEIAQQSLYDYHLNWLVGILHDSKENDPLKYGEKIDFILQDLLPPEKEDVLKYIDQLSSDKSLSKGEQKRQQVLKMQHLDQVPSYIKIFDKYDNCRRFLINPCGKSQKQLSGYYAVSILCYDMALKKHQKIRKFLSQDIQKFFEGLRKRLGSDAKIKEIAESYYASF